MSGLVLVACANDIWFLQLSCTSFSIQTGIPASAACESLYRYFSCRRLYSAVRREKSYCLVPATSQQFLLRYGHWPPPLHQGLQMFPCDVWTEVSHRMQVHRMQFLYASYQSSACCAVQAAKLFFRATPAPSFSFSAASSMSACFLASFKTIQSIMNHVSVSNSCIYMRPFPYFLQHCSPLLYSHLAQHCLRWKYLRHLATLWIQTVGRVFHSRRMIVHENLWNDRTKQKPMSSQIRRWMSKWPTLLCHQGAFRFWVTGSSRWPGYLLFLLKHRITIHHIEYIGHLKFHSTTHWPWKPSTSVHPADVFKHLHKYVTWKLLCHSSLSQVKGTVCMSYLSFLGLLGWL